jgi:putative YhbY family RNA-binding protein
MPAITLTPAQRKDKRGEAHHLDPVVMIGADGLTDGVVKEADAALKAHGLIKLRAASDDRAGREAWMVELADRLNAAPVQHIGKLLVLWRPLPEKQVEEREERSGAPRVVKVLKFSKSNNHRPQLKKIKVYGNERVTTSGNVKRSKRRVTSVKKRTGD